MRFLGGVSQETLDALSAHLAGAARECLPFEARLTGPHLFPPGGRPRVLCLGIALPDAAYRLQEACEGAARGAGLVPEERALLPHLTLARFLKTPRRLALEERDFGTTRISALDLFESRLQAGGSVYSRLRSYPLGPA
jgi:2'-5' RNA ligase